MENKVKTILVYFTLVVVSLFFFFWGLAKAKPFLAPLAVAGLLAMVILPVANWFEKKGLKRGWASLFADLIILLFFVVVGWVVAAQVKSLSQNWPQLKERIQPKINQLQHFVEDKTGMFVQEQKSGMEQQQNEQAQREQQHRQTQLQDQSSTGARGLFGLSGNSILSSAGSFAAKFLGFLGTFLLIFVYIFFFLLYRRKFKKSILKMVPDEKRNKAKEILTESTQISQNYLFGRLILIIFLAVIYSIGLSVSGIQHAILISILAAVLSLLPYVGNIIGFGLAIAMALFSGSGATGAIGVTVTFAIAQFVESYILEPYIVGDKVNINPVFTIIVVVLGSAVWGIVGMLIAIPALGIAKVLFDHIPVLNPLGYLFGGEDMGDDDNEDSFFKKTKRWAQNKFNSDTNT